MKRHEQALLYLTKAAQDEALLDEVLASPPGDRRFPRPRRRL